jgi:hypothetical protein
MQRRKSGQPYCAQAIATPDNVAQSKPMRRVPESEVILKKIGVLIIYL